MMTPKQIRQLREALGLTLDQFRHKFGVSLGAVWRWEQEGAESRYPRREHMERLNELLKQAEKKKGGVLV